MTHTVAVVVVLASTPHLSRTEYCARELWAQNKHNIHTTRNSFCSELAVAANCQMIDTAVHKMANKIKINLRSTNRAHIAGSGFDPSTSGHSFDSKNVPLVVGVLGFGDGILFRFFASAVNQERCRNSKMPVAIRNNFPLNARDETMLDGMFHKIWTGKWSTMTVMVVEGRAQKTANHLLFIKIKMNIIA